MAHAIDETPSNGNGTSLDDIVARENLPFTQVNVALEFMKERSALSLLGSDERAAAAAEQVQDVLRRQRRVLQIL